jgi:dipeptidyl-peptidase-4
VATPSGRLTISDLIRFPRPGGLGPQQISFLEDGQVAYLLPRENSTTLDLWRHDGQVARCWALAPEAGSYSLEEELHRERLRFAWDGITSYQTAGGTLLAFAGSGAWVQTAGEELRRLTETDGASGHLLLKDGQQIVFCRAGEVHLLRLSDGQLTTLTAGAQEGVSHGVAEFAAQEELGRQEGFWVSPDLKWLAFTEVDERHIPLFPIVHQGDSVFTEWHRYPFVGAKNAKVRLGIVPLAGGRVRWQELPAGSEYLARAVWTPHGELAFLVIDRPQRQMAWHLLDPESGAVRLLFEESGLPWLNLPQALTFLPQGGFLTTSERSGFRHLYLGQMDGSLRQLTDGPWMVTALAGISQDGDQAFISHSADGGLDLQLSAVSLSGGERRQLTKGPGRHHCALSPDGRRFVDSHDDPSHPPIVHLHATSATTAATVLHHDRLADAASLNLTPPQLVSIPAADGRPLWATLYRPPTARAGSLYPLVVAAYSGPHAQMVSRSWDLTANLMSQYLAQEGFFVLTVDGRGSFGRGVAHEAPIDRAFGTVELEDQVAAVRWACANEPIDPARVGIHGWSYGGFITLTALLKAPDVFRAGVAGAPVTDFRHYDTAYTERYMGTDLDNHGGYEAAALPPLADRLEGELMIIHGMVDENVHFRHTARMQDALIAVGKGVELVILPASRHSVRRPELRRLVAEKTVSFFRRTLSVPR